MSLTNRFPSRFSSLLSILLIPVLMLAFALSIAAPQKAYAGNPAYLTVEAAPSGAGEIHLIVNGDDWGWASKHDVIINEGDQVTLEAGAIQYATFNGWFDLDSWNYASKETTFTINNISGSWNLQADFQIPSYTLTTYSAPSTGGYVYCGLISSSWSTYLSDSVTAGTYGAVEADPVPGWKFNGWYDGGDNWVSSDNPYYFNVYSDMTLYADYEPIPTYLITFDVNDTSMGEISYSNVSSGSWLQEGTWVKLEANAYTDHYFCGWVADGWPASASVSYEFQIFSDTNLTATFDSIYAERTIVTMPGEGSGWMPDYTVTTGHDFELPACTFDPPAGKEFDEWDVGPAGKVITVNSDMTITALWKDLPKYTVHIEPNGGGGWIADPDITRGTWWTLPDNPFDAPEGKMFEKWDAGYPGEKILIEGETWIYAQWKDPIKISYACTLGNKATWRNGSNAMLSFTFKRNVDDKETFSHFADGKGSVKVDGQLLDPSQYTAISGSLMLTFSPSYLQTLAYGVHTLEVTFDDGVAETSFTTVQEAEKGSDSGDLPISTLVLGGVCAVLLGVIIGMLVRRRSDKSGRHAN